MKKISLRLLLFLSVLLYVGCSAGYESTGTGKVPNAVLSRNVRASHAASVKIILAGDFVKEKSSLRIQEKLLRKGTGLFSALFGKGD